MRESSPSGRRRDENVPPLPGIAGCRRRADVAAGATVPVTAQRPDPTRPDPCGRSQDRHPVLHLPADPAALINLSRAAVALIVIVSADRAASSSRPTIASSRALSISTLAAPAAQLSHARRGLDRGAYAPAVGFVRP